MSLILETVRLGKADGTSAMCVWRAPIIMIVSCIGCHFRALLFRNYSETEQADIGIVEPKGHGEVLLFPLNHWLAMDQMFHRCL